MEMSCEGWEGCWHQKWLGLLHAACHDMRQQEPHPHTGPLASGLGSGVPSTPLHTPRAKAAYRPVPASSLSWHTSCDGVLVAFPWTTLLHSCGASVTEDGSPTAVSLSHLG